MEKEQLLETRLEENNIFEKHYDYYKSIGIETIKQQSGQLQQVSSDYEGRVLFELLQNSFDKAEKNILVKVSDNSLYIANDGTKFSYLADYDYINGNTVSGSSDFKRGDFQSLCSISTSTKIDLKAIGNKGVGFKSVYSIAEHKYVNVYTKAKVINNNTFSEPEDPINFRLYEVFKNKESIPDGFPKDVKESIANKIELVQIERKDRGVPGYYFPMHITEEPEIVNNLFDNGFVTVIEIPFSNIEGIQSLYEEIKQIHFQFVKLKYNKEFNIKFEIEDEEFEKQVEKNSRIFFSVNVDLDKLQALAEDAEIPLAETRVALKIKDTCNDNSEALIYNYLPTKEKSPFKYIDFHADFHTTVDRKSIEFSENSKIGKYNSALMRACIELYFVVLKSLIANNEDIQINTEFINEKDVEGKLEEFSWKFIEVNYVKPEIYNIVRNVLKVDDYIDKNRKGNNQHYINPSKLFSKISEIYFSKSDININQYDEFYKGINVFIHSFTKDNKKRYSRSDEFKRELFGEIKKLNVNVIPNIDLESTEEIFYRKENNNEKKDDDKVEIVLPNIIPIKIINYSIDDNLIREVLGIKDFNNYDELLKHFKQCYFNGNIDKEQISEEEQNGVLDSLYSIFKNKKDINYDSAYRYKKLFSSEEGKINSISNQANFHISTIFLKTKDNKYKPAQLCTKDEIDLNFNSILNDELFLKFIGVSLLSKTIFVDERIYNKLNEGVDYIPKLINIKEANDPINKDLISNVAVCHSNRIIHPALINDNNYSFLTNINIRTSKEDYDILLVKKYSNFPPEYLIILQTKLEESFISYKDEVISLYQSLYHNSNFNYYLVVNNKELKWKDRNSQEGLFVLKNKNDFDFCIDKFTDKNIIAYYSGSNEGITPTKGEIKYERKDEDVKLKKILEEKILYILLEVSLSNNSDVNLLAEDININVYQEKFNSLKVYNCDSLRQELNFEDLGVDISEKAYAFTDNELFFANKASVSQKAQGISDFLFSNISISKEIELIIFYKSTEELERSTSNTELSNIKKKWLPNYKEKYIYFQKSILIEFEFNYADDEKWFIYNDKHRSVFLIELSRIGKLEDLYKTISSEKIKEENIGYFDSFDLLIDYSHINNKIVKIEAYIEANSSEINDIEKTKIDTVVSLAKKQILGIEDEIDEIIKDHPEINDTTLEIEIENNSLEKLKKVQEIESIYLKFNSQENFNSTEKTIDISSSGNDKEEVKLRKKIIYQGSSSQENSNNDLEVTGASGEVEVLMCITNDFLKLDIADQKEGIKMIKEAMFENLRNNNFDKFANSSLELIDSDKQDEYIKSLFSLFYVAKEYKYSSFDLISYREGKVVLLEVKTTKNINNRKFFLSKGEVKTAKGGGDYEIVRVTPTSIIFMGNPIKEISDKELNVIRKGFKMIPRNFEFILK